MSVAAVSNDSKQKIFVIYGDAEQPLEDSPYTYEENVDLLQAYVEEASKYADSVTRQRLVQIGELTTDAFEEGADVYFEKLKLQAFEVANLASVNKAYAVTISSISFFEATIERQKFLMRMRPNGARAVALDYAEKCLSELSSSRLAMESNPDNYQVLTRSIARISWVANKILSSVQMALSLENAENDPSGATEKLIAGTIGGLITAFVISSAGGLAAIAGAPFAIAAGVLALAVGAGFAVGEITEDLLDNLDAGEKVLTLLESLGLRDSYEDAIGWVGEKMDIVFPDNVSSAFEYIRFDNGSVLINEENSAGPGKNNIVVGNDGDNEITLLAGTSVVFGKSGIDEYYVNTNRVVGNQIIVDDGGILDVDGNSLSDLVQVGENAYRSSGGLYSVVFVRISMDQTALVIRRVDRDVSITLLGWTNGAYGITLPDWPTMDPYMGLTEGNDFFGTNEGNGGNDRIDALSGNDAIDGGTGDDRIIGGAGDDFLHGGSGDDEIKGEGGNDHIIDGSQTFAFRDWIGSEYQGALQRMANKGGQLLSEGKGWILYSYNDSIYGETREIYSAGQVNFISPSTYKSGNDTLAGGGGNDFILAGEGRDIVSGGVGNDYIEGGADDDTIDGGNDNDMIWGDTPETHNPAIHFSVAISSDAERYGDDVISAGDGDDIVNGQAGNDIIYGGEGADRLSGDGYAGTNYVLSDRSSDEVHGGAGNDEIAGNGGADNLYGDDGDDTIWGEGTSEDNDHGAQDNIWGGAGKDQISGGVGGDQIWGGDDDDTIFGDATSLDGSKHGKDTIDGGNDNDIIVGGGSDDIILGGDGDDRILGDDSTSNLALQFHGDDLVIGGAGDDKIWGGGGADTLAGGIGNDEISGDEGDDSISGEGGNDKLFGGAGNDTLSGGEGDDDINGEEGDDTLYGATGTNTLRGGAGNDSVYGGAGNDTVDGGDGDDQLYGAEGTDSLIGGAGHDMLQGGAGNDALDSGLGNNDLFGGDGDDTLNALGGDDVLEGGAGNDQLLAGAGTNELRGGEGDDYLQAEAGDDVLEGGRGNDRYVDTGGSNTYIVDATSGNDIIEALASGAFLGSKLLIKGIAPTDVSINQQGADIVVTHGQATTTIKGFFGQGAVPQVELIAFENGMTWGRAEIQQVILENLYQTSAGVIAGFEGDDLIRGADNDNTIYALGGNDTVNAGGGDDLVFGADGNDVLSGGDGDDNIKGESGTDQLKGGNGNDALYGGQGDDILDGGAGNDQLTGDGGNDAYIYGEGSGNDTIFNNDSDSSSQDTVRFAAGISRGDVIFSPSNLDLVVTIKTTGETLTIYGFRDGGGILSSSIDRFVFEDGTIIEATTLIGAYTIGTDNADTLSGFDGDDALEGKGGNDWITGNGGNDTLSGDDGNDVLMAGDGADVLDGGDGNDSLYGDAGNDNLSGGTGNDHLSGGAGDDTISGGDGSDTLVGGYGNDTLDGGVGVDTYMFTREPSTDTLLIGQSDVIQISADQYIYELIFKRDGNDLIISSVRHAGVVIGKDFFAEGQNAQVKLLDLNNYWQYLSAADIQTYPWALTPTYGSNWSDTMNGTVLADRIYGLIGNDMLSGSAGDDYLSGGIGDDLIQGDSGSDYTLGGDGNDRFVIVTETGASDYAEGGDGSDVYEISPSGGAVTIGQLNNSGNSVDQIKIAALISEVVSFEMLDEGLLLIIDKAGVQTSIVLAKFISSSVQHQVVFSDGTILTVNDLKWTGTVGNDAHAGTIRPDMIYGLAGDDDLSGGLASDMLYGGDGVDQLSGDEGADKLYGGNGDDVLDGGYQNDELYGEAGNDRLDGGDGDDLLIGGAGSDELRGGAGNDILKNIWGLWGENRIDRSYGGAGNDTYMYSDSTNTHGGSTLDGAYVHESPNEGVDVVQSNYYNIFLPDNIENLIAEGINSQWYTQGANYEVNYIYRIFRGNSLDNVIRMDSSVSAHWFDSGKYHILDGGLGNDTLIGSNANEIYVVDSIGDVIIESASSSSTDTVRASISYSLTDLMGVENIELTTDDTTAIGDAGKNRLDGSMASGENTLIGGDGDDTYIIDYMDTVLETATGGNDKIIIRRVQSDTNTFEVPVGTNVETFQLDASLSSRVALQGNTESNLLVGNAYGNTLHGGGGNDELLAGGDTYANMDYLYGDEGDDVLTAGSGYNTLVGGVGNDQIQVHYGTDMVMYNQGDGVDTIFVSDLFYSGGTDTLSFGPSISSNDVTWSRDGNDLVITFTNVATDSVTIQDYWEQVEGVDRLSGVIDQFSFYNESGYRTGLTVDALQNRAPVNNYWSLDAVASAGLSFTYTLPDGAFSDEDMASLVYSTANLPSWLSFDPETRTFQGTPPVGEQEGYVNVTATDAYGASASLTLTVSIMNVIHGTGGNDTLTGTSGTDMLVGGAGDDTYTVNISGDLVIEEADEGNDLINASVSYDLPDNVERLTLTGSAGSAYGNELDNTLTGNNYANNLAGGAGNDTLTGNSDNDELDGGYGNDTLDGGSGNDYMYGGDGDDTYIVGSTADEVEEWEDEGIDTVRSSVAYTLGYEVENLVLTGSSGLSGNGNELDNVLTGNSGANTLRGYEGNDYLDGGSGNDTLIGGVGNDTYVVNTTGDVVTEQASQGIDTIRSSVTLTLGTNVENLVLTGTSVINGTGNVLDNLLTGNSGTNTLTGAAGSDTLDGAAGTDTLTGGAGSDTYLHGRGYGADTTIENDATAGVTDVVRFLTGVSYDQLWFVKPSGTNNLEISIIGTSDKLTIKDWYLGSQYRVEEIRTADGNYLLSAANVQALVNKMATMTKPTTTSLSASQRSQLESTFASAWVQQQSAMAGRTSATGGQASIMTAAFDPQLVAAPANHTDWSNLALDDSFVDDGTSRWAWRRHLHGRDLNGDWLKPFDDLSDDHRRVAVINSQELRLLVDAMALGQEAVTTDHHAFDPNERLADKLNRQLFHGRLESRFNEIA